MLVTQTLIQELGLVSRALGLLSQSVDSEGARDALMFSVETLGRIEQLVVDLEFTIGRKAIELESCQREVSRLRAATMRESDPLGSAVRGTGNPSA